MRVRTYEVKDKQLDKLNLQQIGLTIESTFKLDATTSCQQDASTTTCPGTKFLPH